jgi:hypothetical protein
MKILLLILLVCHLGCDKNEGVPVPWGPSDDGGALAETLEGTVRVRILCLPTETRTQHFLVTDRSRRILLDFDALPGLRTGDEVSVFGEWTKKRDRFAVRSWHRLALHPYRLDTPLYREPMVHRVAILAMEHATVSEQEGLEIFNAKVDSAKNFYTETTYGIDVLSAEVFRRYAISYTPQDCLWDNTYNISDALIAAFEQDGYDASSFDHIVCIVPTSCGSDWDGAWADIGGISNKGVVNFELISMFKDNSYDQWFLAHELGHNLGMNHSRSVDCGSKLYVPKAEGCYVDEYGNYNDLMGWGEGVYFSSPYQRYLGWIGASNIVTAQGSDIFNLQPADGPMCGLRAIRIPIPGEPGAYFYLEYRRPRPNSLFAGTGDYGETRHHALLLLVSRDGAGGGDSSFVDRVELGTNNYYEGAQQGTRYDLGQGIAFTVLSMGGPAARISIEMKGAGDHVVDDGSAVFVSSDGSIGPTACDGTDTDSDTGSDTGSPVDTESQDDTATQQDTILDTQQDTGPETLQQGDSESPNIDDTEDNSSDGLPEEPGKKTASSSSSCSALAPASGMVCWRAPTLLIFLLAR